MKKGLKKGFHIVAWDICCLPKEAGGMGMLDYKQQDVFLSARWVIYAIKCNESWNILVQHIISVGIPLNH